jgi:hypothetical protein
MDNRSSFGIPAGAAALGYNGAIQSGTELPVNRMFSSYTVEGSNPIARLTGLPRGQNVTLYCTAAPSFVHSANLLCPGAANMQCAAGDYVLVRSLGNGNWRVIARFPSAGSLVYDVPQSLSSTQRAQLQKNAGVREVLTADRTYYVRTDGSDSNNGLANTAGGAFLTIQKAANVICKTLDCAGFAITIQVADGTYTGGAIFNGPTPNSNQFGIFLIGNTTTPANCVISTTASDAISAQNGVRVRPSGFKLQTTTSGNCINANFNATIEMGGNMDFGSCADSHFNAGVNSSIFSTFNYTISGGATSHWHGSAEGGEIVNGSQTITLTGTPAFSAYFCGTNKGSVVCGGVTFSGSATGTRFVCHVNGTIDAVGQSKTFLPGSAAGICDNGGVYNGSESDKYDPQSAWKIYSPSITALSGTLTTVSSTGKYKLDGTICHFEVSITVGNPGSGATGFFVPIPIQSVNNTPVFGSNPDQGSALMGYLTASSVSCALFVVTGTYPSSGQRVFVAGSYEVLQTA